MSNPLREQIIEVVDERIIALSNPTKEQVSDLNASASVSGMGLVKSISRSATTGISVVVIMTDGQEITAYPGSEVVTVNQRVTIMGGRIFN